MNKLLLLFILVPFTVFAKFYPGTITFENGTQKTGYIKIPNFDTFILKFKSDNSEDVEVFESLNIKYFEVVTENKETLTYYALYILLADISEPHKLKLSENKFWMNKIKENKICLYHSYIEGGSFGDIWNIYYIQKENQNFAFIVDYDKKGFVIQIDRFQSVKRKIEYYFKDVCPNLAGSFKRMDFKSSGLSRIVDLYAQNCGAH